MDVVTSLIADGEAPELGEPGEGALHHPPMPAQPIAGLDALAGDAHRDVATGQCRAAARQVVGRVGMQLSRAVAGATPRAPDRRDAVDHPLEDGTVMPVRPGQPTRQRGAAPVRNKMALRARFAAVRRVRSGGGSPFLAGMLALSRHARSQSIASARPNSSSST